MPITQEPHPVLRTNRIVRHQSRILVAMARKALEANEYVLAQNRTLKEAAGQIRATANAFCQETPYL